MLTSAGQDTAAALRDQVTAFLASRDPVATEPVEFLRARFDAGLAWVHYPAGLGGQGLPRSLQTAVDAQFAAAGAPGNHPERNGIGLGMAAPTVLAFGTPEQQQRWLRPLWTGEEIWCQLFSEPGRVVHPGQPRVEPGAEELPRLGGRRVVLRQERGDLAAQVRGGVLARAGQHSGPPAT